MILRQVVGTIRVSSNALVVIAKSIGLWNRMGPLLRVPQRYRVLAFQRGVVLLGGSVETVLDPGSHWITPNRTLLICDMGPNLFQTPLQDFPTGDDKELRLSLGGRYRVVDPALFIAEDCGAFGAFYSELLQEVPVLARAFTKRALLDNSSLLTDRIRKLFDPRAAHLGFQLTHLELRIVSPLGHT